MNKVDQGDEWFEFTLYKYKLRNFGQNLANVYSIRLIRWSEIWFWETELYPLLVCFTKAFQTS
jgi:hypothetical protein